MKDFALRCLIATIIVGAAVILWRAADVFVLIFGAVVVAVALRALTSLLTRHTPLKDSWALGLVVLVLLIIVVGLGALIGSRLADQFGQLVHTVEGAWSQLYAQLEKSDFGRTILSMGSRTAVASSGAHLAIAASSSVTLVTSLLIILLVGLFTAAEPGFYRRGLLLLAPLTYRKRVERLLDAFGVALTHWLQGTLIAMLTVGVMTCLGLWIIGVPMALSLGILAGIAEFVPYVGPIVSAIPAILVAFTLGPGTALETAGLYLVIHGIEAYVLVPLIQRKAVALPPALGILAVVFFGLMLGPLGVIFAHPLTVCIIVLVQQLAVQPAVAERRGMSSSPPGR